MKGQKPKATGNVIPMAGGGHGKCPDAPETMTEAGRMVWDELAPQIHRIGRLLPHYRYQFATYCEATANFILATNEIEMGDKPGRWYEVKTRNGLQQKKTQAYLIQQEASAAMARLGALFGLSPVDAARVDTGGQGDLFDQVAEAILGKRSGRNEPD